MGFNSGFKGLMALAWQKW